MIQTPQHPQQVLNAVIPKRSEGSASIALASAADSEFPGGPSFAFLAKGGSLCCCLLPRSLIPLVIPSEVPPSLPRRRGISLRSALLAADRTRAAELSLPTAVLFAFFHSKESGFGFGVWTGRASLVLFACNRPHLEAIRFFAQIPVRSAKPYFAVIQRSIFRDEGSLFDLNFLPVPKSKPISRLVVAALAATKKSPRSSFLSRGLLARALVTSQHNPPREAPPTATPCVLCSICTNVLSCIAFVSSPSSDRTRGSHAPLLSQIIYDQSGSNENQPRHQFLPDF